MGGAMRPGGSTFLQGIHDVREIQKMNTFPQLERRTDDYHAIIIVLIVWHDRVNTRT